MIYFIGVLILSLILLGLLVWSVLLFIQVVVECISETITEVQVFGFRGAKSNIIFLTVTVFGFIGLSLAFTGLLLGQGWK